MSEESGRHFNLLYSGMAKEDMSMLERLQGWARRFAGARPWLLVLALLSLSGCAWIVMTSGNQAGDVALIPNMLLFAWATMVHSFLNLFAQVPAGVVPGMKFASRFKARFKRSAYYLFAILMAVVSLLLIVTTLQMASAWRTMY